MKTLKRKKLIFRKEAITELSKVRLNEIDSGLARLLAADPTIILTTGHPEPGPLGETATVYPNNVDFL